MFSTDRQSCIISLLGRLNGLQTSEPCGPSKRSGFLPPARFPGSARSWGRTDGFLFARCADGSIRHFDKAELAFFFSNLGGKPYRVGGLLFVEYEIIVFGSLQWFKGTVECPRLRVRLP